MTSLALAVLLAAQQLPAQSPGPSDSIYETPALEALVARVAEANRIPPADLRSYRARVETELSVVRVESDGRETVLQVEQVASDLAWRSDGGVLMQLLGYRAQLLGPSFSMLSFFEVPWAVPSLYGESLDLVRTSAPERSEDGRLLVRRAVHPLASTREQVYRFSGGDTVLTLRLPARTVPIVRIHVEPVHPPERPTQIFEGDIDVDVTRMHVVSMQGRLFVSAQEPSILDAFAQGVLLVRFESSEYDERYWLPRQQRFDVQAISRLGEGRVVFRTVSRFLDVEPNDQSATLLAAPPDSFPGGRLVGRDNLGLLASFGDWRLPIGELNARSTARDFDQYIRVTGRRAGERRLSAGARHFSQLLRVNPVEGVYTGLGVTYRFGDAAPGLLARAHGGWAWEEGAARGGLELLQRRGAWEYSLRGERQIVHTHDFLYWVESEPDGPPLIGAESFTYFDRRSAAAVARRFREGGFTWRVELARVGDRPAGARGAPSDSTLALQGALRGDYWRGRIELRRNPSAGGFSLRPGLFLRLAQESASGDFDWHRVEVGAGLRRTLGRWSASVSGDAGVIHSSEPPPQALFELGVVSDAPGADQRTYAGDKAALGRANLMYTLPLFGSPIRLGGLWLPAPAPSPSVGVRLAWTDASAEALTGMAQLGWSTSNGVRSALDLRMRFFGGGVSIGAARALARDAQWELVWGLVGTF
jgi:hypothetical protein